MQYRITWFSFIFPSSYIGKIFVVSLCFSVGSLELGELFAKDALHRNESCGGHFREEYQTPDGEAQRDDENFAYVAAWEYKGKPSDAVLHKEELVFDNVKLVQRSYK